MGSSVNEQNATRLPRTFGINLYRCIVNGVYFWDFKESRIKWMENIQLLTHSQCRRGKTKKWEDAP